MRKMKKCTNYIHVATNVKTFTPINCPLGISRLISLICLLQMTNRRFSLSPSKLKSYTSQEPFLCFTQACSAYLLLLQSSVSSAFWFTSGVGRLLELFAFQTSHLQTTAAARGRGPHEGLCAVGCLSEIESTLAHQTTVCLWFTSVVQIQTHPLRFIFANQEVSYSATSAALARLLVLSSWILSRCRFVLTCFHSKAFTCWHDADQPRCLVEAKNQTRTCIFICHAHTEYNLHCR